MCDHIDALWVAHDVHLYGLYGGFLLLSPMYARAFARELNGITHAFDNILRIARDG